MSLWMKGVVPGTPEAGEPSRSSVNLLKQIQLDCGIKTSTNGLTIGVVNKGRRVTLTYFGI